MTKLHPKVKNKLVEFFTTIGYDTIAKEIKKNNKPIENVTLGFKLWLEEIKAKNPERLQEAETKIKALTFLVNL